MTKEEEIKLKKMASSIRVLSALSVSKAGSGHPGLPLGMADVVSVLYKNHLNFDNDCPTWLNRDRLILSAGHGSAMLYSLFYLLRYRDIELKDLLNFRQLGFKTAGHPEYGELAAIETTTGPLGQGIANACGMAVAQKILAANLHDDIINHKIYVIAGDGCLMEGISYEASSLAGHLGLDNLVVLFDDNSVTIDGKTDITVSEDIQQRFISQKWNVLEMDGHNYQDIDKKLAIAKNLTNLKKAPTIIKVKTTIAKGATSKEGSSSAHGSPLNVKELNELLTTTAWQDNIVKTKPVTDINNLTEYFNVDSETQSYWLEAIGRGKSNVETWQKKYINLSPTDKRSLSELNQYSNKSRKYDHDNCERRKIVERCVKLQENYFKTDNQSPISTKTAKANFASRVSSANILEQLVIGTKYFVGGSADLTPSNGTYTKNHSQISKDNFKASYIHYGVREHAMAAIMNGLTIYGICSYSGTFLVFSDYMRPSIRLSALMEIGSIFIFTHDSIAVGEDGSTHQPIEHLSSLRAIPNLLVLRPADDLETLEAWEIALNNIKGPTAICLSRQSLSSFRKPAMSQLPNDQTKVLNLSKLGAYPINHLEDETDIILFATGSEVQLALKVYNLLKLQTQLKVQVYSCPSLELFLKRGGRNILKASLRVFIEASDCLSLHQLAKKNDIFINISTFGRSGKGANLLNHFGFDEKAILKQILKKIET